MDRRTFLTLAPRRLLARAQDLMGLVTAAPQQDVSTCRVPGRRLAVLDVERCLAWGHGSCQLCYLRCPLRDVALVCDDGRPVVVASACDGCGVCVEVCRTVNDVGAIDVVAVASTS